jgi:hypothetical protein
VKLWRVLPFDRGAGIGEPGGPLWFPRRQQGAGRHDNPDLYGCLYVAEDPVSAVAESLVAFRGVGQVTASMLVRLDRPLALAELEISDAARVVDLDDPSVLVEKELRPSRVATRIRRLTQDMAADVYALEPEACALRWWSTIESTFANLTLFEDRAAPLLTVADVADLRIDDDVVREAAALLGLAPIGG